MRIAILGYAHPFGEGTVYGAERMIYYLIRDLRDMGHECVVFSVKGCNLPGFEFVEMIKPWFDDKDIYFEAVKNWEETNGKKFDYVHSYQASGLITHELRNGWPYSLEPFFPFHRFHDKVIWYSKKLQSVSGGKGTVIYFGLPEEDYSQWTDTHQDYLVWIGRMDMGKAPDIAIDVAKKSNHRLVLMGPAYHYPYCHDKILPQVDGEQIIWMRGCDDEMKREIMLGAKALIAPLWENYHEMFGIVNIEALACGVPIIGWNNSNVPSAMGFGGGEIIEHGVHGFIVNHNGYGDDQRESTINEAVGYINYIDKIDRFTCRTRYLERFTSRRMTEDHLAYFEGNM